MPNKKEMVKIMVFIEGKNSIKSKTSMDFINKNINFSNPNVLLEGSGYIKFLNTNPFV